MKILIGFAIAAIAASVAHARPVVIEHTSRIAIPDSSYYPFVWAVAIDTDDAVIMGTKEVPDPGSYPDSQTTSWLFKRNGSNWDFVRQLATVIDGNEGDGVNSKGIHMRNGVAALAMQPLYIFERRNGEWVEGAGSPLFGDRGDEVWIQGYRIFFGEHCWGGTIIERDADTVWRGKQRLFGDFCGSTDGASGGPVGLWNNWAVVSNLWNDEGLPPETLSMFRNMGRPSGWVKQPVMIPPAGHSYGGTFMNNDEMYVADIPYHGTWLFRRGTDDVWREQGHLTSSGDYMTLSGFVSGPVAGGMVATNAHFLRQVFDYDLQKSVVQVFQRNSSGGYEHRATLVAGDGGSLGQRVAISGRRVLVNGNDGAYYFTLPETLAASPAVIQDTFATTTATGWTPTAGGQFAVVQSGNTRVYRQSSTAGDAASVLDASDWTQQSIQADVKPTAVNGSDRWVGLATRRTDPSNYYYVTLRSSGIIALKVLYRGQFVSLDTATYPFALNTTYRLRLESFGTLHRVYVDGNLVLEARNSDLKHGRAALLTSRAAADFDNVVVSPSGTTTEFLASDSQFFSPPWEFTGGSWAWENDGSATQPIFVQSSLTGDGRAAIGPSTTNGDHIVEVRARSRAFGTVPDPWFGIMTRYGGPTGYTYLSLRRSNVLTLRRVSGTQIEQLGAVPFTVTPGAWYRLRLEAVGTRLRAYVNGRLMIEATVSSTSGARSGLVTYGMSAEYDDYRAVRP